MMMNEKQNEALVVAQSGHNLLLLGAAGTGKTFVVREMVRQLREKGRRVALTCTTGIACSLYQGLGASTIHRWSGFGDGRHDVGDMESLARHSTAFQGVRERVLTTDTLIIDECSMLSSRFFSALLQVLRIRGERGMQLILAGDFMQLPPVPNSAYGEIGDYCFQNLSFSSYFPHRIILTQVTRQQEPELILAISEAAHGAVSQATVDFIARLQMNPAIQEPTKPTKLFARNDQVDDYNRHSILAFDGGELYEFKSRDDGDLTKLNRILAPKILWLKVGAPVILLRNLSDLLVNGLQGSVVRVSEQGPVVHFPSVDCTVPLERFRFTVFSPKENRDVASREQFPVKLSFAITIHKAQGLTLDYVEIDCRGMFKPGQLGVALGRARSSAGLRVVNFTRQCILRQPVLITQFMQEPSKDLQDDLQCCKQEIESNTKNNETGIPAMANLNDIEVEGHEQCDDEFDEDFDKAILAILEEETTNVKLPDDLDLNGILESIRCKDVLTPAQCNTNKILDDIDPQKYRTFCKNEFSKMSSFLSALTQKIDAARPISVSEQSDLFSKVHQYQISIEFRMNCLSLFDKSFSEDHLHICYNISVAIRQYLLVKKAEAYPAPGESCGRRQVTHASHARIRYIAGYCVAKVRHKYNKQKQSYMYDTSAAGQSIYKEARCAVNVLDSLKIEEQYLYETTSMPYSLIDIERRQNVNRSLTSVSDALFSFFLKLTDKGLSLLVEKTLNEKGNDVFQYAFEAVHSCETLYDQFITVVDMSEVGMTGFDEATVDAELKSVLVKEIYRKFVKTFLMVMVSQFRKDVLDSLSVTKKMAHRKQIRVSSGSSGQKGKKQKMDIESSTDESASTSASTQPGLLASDAPEEAEDPIVCSLCDTRDKDKDWLQCDGCQKWNHRLCLGLKHHMKWKKATKKGSKFYCKACE